MNGMCKSYYENGQLKKICSYIDDKKNGNYKEYHGNGQLKEKCYYTNGIKIE